MKTTLTLLAAALLGFTGMACAQTAPGMQGDSKSVMDAGDVRAMPARTNGAINAAEDNPAGARPPITGFDYARRSGVDRRGMSRYTASGNQSPRS